jgi:hypothetical protein
MNSSPILQKLQEALDSGNIKWEREPLRPGDNGIKIISRFHGSLSSKEKVKSYSGTYAGSWRFYLIEYETSGKRDVQGVASKGKGVFHMTIEMREQAFKQAKDSC